jgi:OmpA-OmpF porin, OOP family
MVFDEAALFDVDKADLKPQGKEQIKKYRDGAQAEMSRADKIRVTGHTDSTGSADYNQKLSMRRAEAVRDYLISLGGDPKKFEVIGAGETKPIADNSTPAGRTKNRRVEVEVLGLAR